MALIPQQQSGNARGKQEFQQPSQAGQQGQPIKHLKQIKGKQREGARLPPSQAQGSFNCCRRVCKSRTEKKENVKPRGAP